MNNRYFIQSELALAAYSNLYPDMPQSEYLASLQDSGRGLSPLQSDLFTFTYRVVDRYFDATGLSATVFANDEAGEIFLAIRGTEEDDLRDILTDLINIIWLGSTTLQPQFISLKLKVSEWLEKGILPQNFTVTGHSLGGFLATGLVADPLFANHVSHAYLFNTPGVGGFSGPPAMAYAILDFFGLAPIYDQSKISNIIASTGISPIAGLGFDVAPPIDIIIEDQTASDISNPPSAFNHSQQVLTDALAVYSVYSQLAPNLELSKLSKLIDAFGSTKDIAGSNGKTLESALDSVRTILLNPNNGKVVLGEDQKIKTGDRESLYSHSNDEQFKTKLAELAGKVQLTLLPDLSASAILSRIESNGQPGLAARFALVALNPYMLEGDGIDYGAFNLNGALERFNPTIGSGALTSKYLVDRMTMLIRKNWFNIEDKNPLDATVAFSRSNHPYQNINDYYEDVATGYKISQGELSGKTPRYFFGADGADNPAASAVEDHFYGGGGDDLLKGREGDDYLEGGTGNDTYTLNTGDGIDTIWDADGQGVIRFGAVEVTGITGVDDKDWAKLGNSWVDQKNGIEYVLQAQGNGTNDLLIVSGNGSGVRIKAWSDGGLGITLGENTLPVAAVYDQTITEEVLDRNDTLEGGAGNDLIQGLGGDDFIQGKDGNDRLEGGSGTDSLAGNLDNDMVLGGTGSDLIAGQEGDDRLYAETEYTIDEAYSLGETQAGSGERGDLLDGGPNNDVAVGEAGDDILMGGMGRDILMGLGGDDTIEGDIDFTAGNPSWLVTRTVTSENNTTVYSRSYNFTTTHSTVDPNTGDDDVIYSGTGEDWIFAGGGNDFVDAGADGDVVFGEGGNDFILGQQGDDALVGDNVNLDAALHGTDYIDGGDGIDLIYGEGGADHLLGGAGDDKLVGDGGFIPVEYQGNDVLDGGSGIDELTGGYGNDTLIGGTGADELYGGPGDDTYLGVERGDFIGDIEGKSTIVLADKNNLTTSALNLPTGFTLTALTEPAAELTNTPVGATWLSDVIVLRITLENGDTLDLQAALYGMDAQIFFDQGTQGIDLESWVSENLHDVVSLSLNFDWSAAGLQQPVTYLYSGTANDSLYGGVHNDTLKGYGGNDQILGNAGDDSILGGLGDDVLVGEDGADTLQGEAGADQLQGGLGDDNLDGGADGDTLFGQEGNDTLDGGDGSDELQGGLGADTLTGATGDDLLVGQEDDDTLDGGEGSDELQGGLGADALSGAADDDRLFGQEGSDVLDGGVGNDVLQGNSGDDVYRFELGGGRDEIWEEGDSSGDVLRFGENIAPSDIEVAKSGNHLLLFHVNGADQLTITNWYLDASWRLMQFEFADGTIWSAADAGNRGLANLRGTTGSDTLYGSASNETLSGLNGNDTLYGNAGNDTLIGGSGNDSLFGGSGENTYRFALGDGNDTITPDSNYSDTLRFAADIASSDLIVERMGNDLLLHHQNGSDSVKIIGWYSVSHQLKQVVFDSDATTWSNSTLYTMGITHADSYTLNPGDGAKSIEDWGGADTLTFADGIGETDITISRIGQDLKFTHVNGLDSVTVNQWFNNLSNQIETIRFAATGTVLTAAQHTTPFLTLTGTVANDVIQGGNAYGETLAGLGGNDTLNGGDGQDTYLFNQGDGQDTVTDTSYAGNFFIFGPGLLSQLNVSTNASNDTVYSFGTDKVTVKAGSSSQILKFISNGTAAADTLNGGSYNDIIYGLDGNDAINGSSGTDDLYGDAGNDTITGGDDTDWLYGGDGDDVLDGNKLTGIDEIETNFSNNLDYYVGGKGNDTLHGNSNNDSYYFNLGDGNDVIIEGAYYLSGYWYYSGSDKLIFGAGITADSIQANKLNNDLVITVSAADTVTIRNWFSDYKSQVESFRFADGSYLSATDMSRMANTLRGTEGDDILTLGSTSADGVLHGEGGNDTLNGGSGNDALYGGNGNDTLNGESGNDSLYGESGNDALNGGGGNDEYFFSRNGGQDVISDTSGTDTVRFDASITATDFALSRNGNDLVLTQAASDDKLTIKNYLNGDLDLYTMSGSNVMNYSNYAIVESFIFADGSFMPSQASIQDSLLNIRGAAGDDALNGTDWADVMYGDAGNDVLYGFADDDVLYGGSGNDTLNGGVGSYNLLYGQDGDDVLIAEDGTGFGHDYLHGGYGSDTYVFKSKASFNIYDDSGSDDNIAFTDNIGLLDLSFQRWNNELDIYVNGGGHINIPNHFQSNSYQVERLVLPDGTVLGLRDVQMGTGAKDTLNGTAEDSILLGAYDSDILNGNDGNDWLDGGTLGDTMAGGNGNDIYFVDVAKDSVTELANQGIDTVVSTISNTLGANIENLMLMGSSKINGTGNTLDNRITGNSAVNTLNGNDGNDYLDGQGGIDKMIGGAGNDTYVVDNASETLTERANDGTDTVLSSVTLTLPKYIENLTLTGTLTIHATGNTLNNVLTGNAANNILTGGTGGDTYQLGRGFAIDTVIENDTTANIIDTAQFSADIAADQIWFQHVGNHLEVSIIGTTDKLIVQDWYLGNAYHIEQFKTADGFTLQHGNVETLVNAMASFAPPDLGQTTLPGTYESSLDPVIASLWI